MVLMGQGIKNAFPRDYRGNVTADIPMMRNVRDYTSFPLLVNISAGFPGTKEWVQQVNSRFHLPMVRVTAAAPRVLPVPPIGPLLGLLGGMAGRPSRRREEDGDPRDGHDRWPHLRRCALASNSCNGAREGDGVNLT
jgi:hypothetical protein